MPALGTVLHELASTEHRAATDSPRSYSQSYSIGGALRLDDKAISKVVALDHGYGYRFYQLLLDAEIPTAKIVVNYLDTCLAPCVGNGLP